MHPEPERRCRSHSEGDSEAFSQPKARRHFERHASGGRSGTDVRIGIQACQEAKNFISRSTESRGRKDLESNKRRLGGDFCLCPNNRMNVQSIYWLGGETTMSKVLVTGGSGF